MILADKIINERKKNGWSQEELAEQLGVSRQSVSKWEGAQAIPDLSKIIAMADIFGVTTDYLLKDDMEIREPNSTTDIPSDSPSDSVPPKRKVSMEEANEFLSLKQKYTPSIANAVMLCVLSPAVLIALAGLSAEFPEKISENLAAGIGLLCLFGCIAYAVFRFIVCSSKLSKYDFLQNQNIETEYGVTGMVKAKKEAFQDKYTRMLACGVVLCVLCAIPLITAALANAADYILVLLTSFLLVMIGAGVNIIIRSSCIMGSYDKLLEEGDFTVEKKNNERKAEPWASVFWGVATAVYLGWSFYSRRWDITWMVWPVAGVLYGCVFRNIVSAIGKDK